MDRGLSLQVRGPVRWLLQGPRWERVGEDLKPEQGWRGWLDLKQVCFVVVVLASRHVGS